MRYPAFPARNKGSLINMKNLDKEDEDQCQGGERRVWIMALFLGTMFLYAARSAVPLCIAAMSKDLAWDKEADVCIILIYCEYISLSCITTNTSTIFRWCQSVVNITYWV